MRASSNGVNPHSYGESFSALGRRGPSALPTTSRATPMTLATIRNIRVGRYSASTRVLSAMPRGRGLDSGHHRCRASALGAVVLLRLLEWCPRGDSNPYDLSRYHLKVMRLPIPPPGH